jgi:hypothetical protein
MHAFRDHGGTGNPIMISRLASKAIEFYENWERGVLPSTGGWLDQDPDHVFLIKTASELREKRKRMAERQRQRKGRR